MLAKKAIHAGLQCNLDIMFGLKQQTLTQALADISQTIALEPDHISCYQLTIEPNTPFAQNPPILPHSDTIFDMQEAIVDYLEQHHYQRYEISAYARNGAECQHNLNYWHFGDYIAIGAGAHGKLSADNGEIIRYRKHKHPRQYLNSDTFTAQRAIHTRDGISIRIYAQCSQITGWLSAFTVYPAHRPTVIQYRRYT